MEESLAWLVLCGLLAIMTGIEFGTSGKRRSKARGLAVLVIESDERLRHDLCAFVRRRGHEVAAAATAGAALRLARSRPPDLVLLDQAALPAAGHFRLGDLAPAMVLMVGAPDAIVRERARALAIDDVLRKPLRVEALAAVLGRYRPA